MIDNPFLPSPTQAAAWSEGFIKGFAGGPPPEPSEAVDAASIGAFNQGVLAGEQGAVNGLEPTDPCISAAEEGKPGEVPALVIDGLDLASAVMLKSLSHGLSGLFVMLVELAVNLPHRTEDPETVLPGIGQQMINTLNAFGIGSLELFVGAGVDPLATDCEIRITPLFKSLEQARDAAIATGCQQWLVGRWRTDQSNSFKIVDESRTG